MHTNHEMYVVAFVVFMCPLTLFSRTFRLKPKQPHTDARSHTQRSHWDGDGARAARGDYVVERIVQRAQLRTIIAAGRGASHVAGRQDWLAARSDD